MLFSTIFSVTLLAVSAVAAPLPVKRDLNTITNAMTAISQRADQLTSAVNRWDGSADGIAPILEGSIEILDLINSGTQKIQGTQAIGLLDAIYILSPVYTLYNSVSSVVTALTNKMQAFENLSVRTVVKDQLAEQKGAADQLVQAITSKVPSYISFVVPVVGDQITFLLQQGMQSFDAGPGAAAPLNVAPAPSSGAPAPSRGGQRGQRGPV